MDKQVSIVLSRENKNYRRLAQSHYGLTDDQMKGKHVHHNPPRFLGGRDIPEHLYVYSLENHTYVHDDDFVSFASEGGRVGGSSNTPLQQSTRRENGTKNIKSWNSSPRSKESQVKGGKSTVERGLAIHNPKFKESEEFKRVLSNQGKNQVPRLQSDPRRKEWNTRGGKSNTKAQKESRRKSGEENSKIVNSQKWECTVTGYISTAGGLSAYQRSRGIDTSNRRRVPTTETNYYGR